MTPSQPRVLLFGASGYTGRLTALALARRGLRPVLVGRSREKLESVVGEILSMGGVAGGLEVADVSDPASVSSVVQPGDVLISTVGPFVSMGEPAIEAAIARKAGAYIDSTGEPAFIRRVFDEWSGPAAEASVPLLTAFGYDYVPGNLAAALATRDATAGGVAPVRIDVGYFFTGKAAMSGGTAASSAAAITLPQFEFNAAHIVTVRGGHKWRTFEIDGNELDGITVGSTEHFTVPRLSPSITEVNSYLGWAGKRSRTVSRMSAATSVAAKVPGADKAIGALGGRAAPAPGEGPDAEARAQSRTLAVAEAFDGVGRLLSTVVIDGPNGYDLTAELLAWAAHQGVTGNIVGAGALGPAEAFGSAESTAAERIDALVAGCASIGLARVE